MKRVAFASLRKAVIFRSKRNLVQGREFSEMLKKTLNAYHNRAIATQDVIEELIKLAKQMSAATQRGVDFGLNDDETAFYTALAVNDSAVEAMGKDELKVIAAELVTQVRKLFRWSIKPQKSQPIHLRRSLDRRMRTGYRDGRTPGPSSDGKSGFFLRGGSATLVFRHARSPARGLRFEDRRQRDFQPPGCGDELDAQELSLADADGPRLLRHRAHGDRRFPL
jgi:hypothetical protein